MATEVIEVELDVIRGTRREEMFGVVFGSLGITLKQPEKS